MDVLGDLLHDFVEDGGVDLQVDVGVGEELASEVRDGPVDAEGAAERVGDDLVGAEVAEVVLDEAGPVWIS